MQRERVPWDNDFLTIRQLLKYTAEKYEEKPCIKYVDENNEIISKSYREMCEDSFSVGRYIRSMEKERIHISIVGKTSYDFLCCLNGIFTGGNVAVTLGPDSTPSELKELINASDSQMIIYDSFCKDKVNEILKDCPGIKNTLYFGDENFSEVYEKYNSLGEYKELSDVEIDPDACSLIMYTSGTTGKKKGAMLSSRALISNVCFKEMSYAGDHVALNVLPMHHIFCFSCDYLKNLMDGVTVCLNGDIKNIGENLLRFEPTVIRLVPMVVEGLLKKVRLIRKKDPELTPREAAQQVFGRRLIAIIASSAYLNPKTAEEFDEMGINLRQGYGMTETGPRIAVPDGKTDCDSVGRIISICNARIEKGEIQVKSPSLMMGYYKDEEETDKVFTEDGWFRTGDMGRIGDDKQLYVTGRLKNLIILSNGENVSPEEIEKKYNDEPIVKEIMVYEENDRITAEVYPDMDYAEKNEIHDVEATVVKLVLDINKKDTTTKEVSNVKVRWTPFERTSTGKIIRKSVQFA